MKKYFSYSVLLMVFMLGSAGFCMDALEENDSSSKRITLKLKEGVPATAINAIATDFGLTEVEKRRVAGYYKASIHALDPASVLTELNQRGEIEVAYIDKPVAAQLLRAY